MGMVVLFPQPRRADSPQHGSASPPVISRAVPASVPALEAHGATSEVLWVQTWALAGLGRGRLRAASAPGLQDRVWLQIREQHDRRKRAQGQGRVSRSHPQHILLHQHRAHSPPCCEAAKAQFSTPLNPLVPPRDPLRHRHGAQHPGTAPGVLGSRCSRARNRRAESSPQQHRSPVLPA